MPDAKPQYQRKIKNVLVLPSFQLRYIFWLSASGLCLVAMNALVIYYYFRENYLSLIELSPMTEEAKTQLMGELHHFIGVLISCSFLFIFLVMILGIIFSHRTAGPLFHFKRVFEEIKSGNSKARIRLRPKDEFHEIADAFNQMMDSQNKR